MKKIPLRGELGRGKYALVDDEDYERIARYKWYAGPHGYARTHTYDESGKDHGVLMTRMITGAPKNMEIDHIDGNKLNNQRNNLRLCSHAENTRNVGIRKTNTSGYKGVSWNKRTKKWVAQICFNYKKIILGRFENVADAARAYNEASGKYHGEFARNDNVLDNKEMGT